MYRLHVRFTWLHTDSGCHLDYTKDKGAEIMVPWYWLIVAFFAGGIIALLFLALLNAPQKE